MAERAKIIEVPVPPTKCFHSGSTQLDLALGGYGWRLGRIVNIVGDKSTGKTLQAIEGFANFARQFPNGRKRYGEAEAAFDDDYAQTMGMPLTVSRPDEPLRTVEQFRDDLADFLKSGGPSMYVLDSLDALSDDAEVERFGEKDKDGNDKGSYGAEKAKKLSALFRGLIRDIETNDCCLMIISQTREKIGVMFGEKYQRSGGKALDFYASQVVWLAEEKKLERQIMKEKRVFGLKITANVKKLKTGNPHRKVSYDLIFNYGIDDELSMLQWLSRIETLTAAQVTGIEKEIVAARKVNDRATVELYSKQLKDTTREAWEEIEARLAPPMKKYGD